MIKEWEKVSIVIPTEIITMDIGKIMNMKEMEFIPGQMDGVMLGSGKTGEDTEKVFYINPIVKSVSEVFGERMCFNNNKSFTYSFKQCFGVDRKGGHIVSLSNLLERKMVEWVVHQAEIR